MRRDELRRESRRLLAAPDLRIVGATWRYGRLGRLVAIDRGGFVRLSVAIPRDRGDLDTLLQFLEARRRVIDLYGAPCVVGWRPLAIASATYEALVRFGGYVRLLAGRPAWRDVAPLAAAWQGGSIGASRPHLPVHGPGGLGQARGVLRLLEELAG